MVVLPGQGIAIQMGTNVGSGPVFDVARGLTAGDWIKRLWITWQTQDAGVLLFGASLGGSTAANQEAFGAGRSLVRSGVAASGFGQVWQITTVGASTGNVVVPVGVQVGESSKAIIFFLTAGHTLIARIFWGVDVVRVVGDTPAVAG